jgi:AraC-like DNA-binding protein
MNIKIINGNYSFDPAEKYWDDTLLGIILLEGEGELQDGVLEKELSACSFVLHPAETLERLELLNAKAVLFQFITRQYPEIVPDEVAILDAISVAIINDVFFEHQRSIAHQKAALEFVWYQVCDITADKTGEVAHKDMSLVDTVLDYLQKHMDEAITLDGIASHLDCDKMKILAEFRKSNYQSPIKELAAMRVEHARSLLMRSELTIAQIASRVGYDRLSTFNHFFKRNTGTSPREYRENHLWLM